MVRMTRRSLTIIRNRIYQGHTRTGHARNYYGQFTTHYDSEASQYSLQGAIMDEAYCATGLGYDWEFYAHLAKTIEDGIRDYIGVALDIDTFERRYHQEQIVHMLNDILAKMDIQRKTA